MKSKDKEESIWKVAEELSKHEGNVQIPVEAPWHVQKRESGRGPWGAERGREWDSYSNGATWWGLDDEAPYTPEEDV